jgi:hypothetical protein
MTPGEIVVTVYWLAVSALIIIATAGALWFSRHSYDGAIPMSLDCRDGIHAGCAYCDACPCHGGAA